MLLHLLLLPQVSQHQRVLLQTLPLVTLIPHPSPSMYLGNGPGLLISPSSMRLPMAYSTSTIYRSFTAKKNFAIVMSKPLLKECSILSTGPNLWRSMLDKRSCIKRSKSLSHSLVPGRSTYRFGHTSLRNMRRASLCSMRGFSISFIATSPGH